VEKPPENTPQKIRRHLERVQEALHALAVEDIARAVDVLREAREHGRRVFTVGNGGSAATASHFANDLLKMCGLDATCLTDHVTVMLAYGNDTDWDEMFSGSLERILRPGDVLVAITCGGRSSNVYRAAEAALDLGGELIAMTGDWEDNALPTPEAGVMIVAAAGGRITVQEDAHMVICHAIAEALAKGKE
jgi:D-sedoheptulose 7-phosphate isomerase